MWDFIWKKKKITTAKKGWKHGSSGRVPEFKSQYHQNKNKLTITTLLQSKHFNSKNGNVKLHNYKLKFNYYIILLGNILLCSFSSLSIFLFYSIYSFIHHFQCWEVESGLRHANICSITDLLHPQPYNFYVKINKSGWVLMAHTCNPTYSGSRDHEDRGSKSAQRNSSRDPI
jgi:hypothetical protein